MWTKLGEWLTTLLRKNSEHRWLFGFTVRSVTFADHRSGKSAIQVIVGFGHWEFCLYPLTWRLPYRSPQRIVSLREQIASSHPTFDDGEENEAAERAALRAKTKLVMDYIKEQNQPE